MVELLLPGYRVVERALSVAVGNTVYSWHYHLFHLLVSWPQEADSIDMLCETCLERESEKKREQKIG